MPGDTHLSGARAAVAPHPATAWINKWPLRRPPAARPRGSV